MIENFNWEELLKGKTISKVDSSVVEDVLGDEYDFIRIRFSDGSYLSLTTDINTDDGIAVNYES